VQGSPYSFPSVRRSTGLAAAVAGVDGRGDSSCPPGCDDAQDETCPQLLPLAGGRQGTMCGDAALAPFAIGILPDSCADVSRRSDLPSRSFTAADER
jgi:hypothetical protein